MSNSSSYAPSKTYVYIDGFNFYHGAMEKRGKGRKWLNFQKWLVKLFPSNNIIKIKHFTARSSGKYDPGKPLRQAVYFRALNTLSPVYEPVLGKFKPKNIKIRLNEDTEIRSWIFVEKGTDVNLATHLVSDAHQKKFETAIVISNDSDLAEAIRIVVQDLNMPVGIVNPHIGKHFSSELLRYASFKEVVREAPILASQFSDLMKDSAGTFTKPREW